MDEQTVFLPRAEADRLLEALRGAGFGRILGPVAREGTLLFQPLRRWDDLPAGVRDVQQPGRYRLQEQDTPRCFAWANGPQALKPLTFRPREPIWRAQRSADGQLSFQSTQEDPEPTALIGLRACDLAALDLQERHFMHGRFPDPWFRRRREALFLVGMSCAHPAQTCFCASTGDGPAISRGHDLGMAELDEGYLLWAGTQAGKTLLERLDLDAATAAQRRTVEKETHQAAMGQRRTLPGRHLKQGLYERLQAGHWKDVGERCLSCGNCTAVCPTCFCHMEMDEPALGGDSSEHLRQWSSCFNAEHSFMGHFVVRSDTRLRYRQWLTHKLGSWHEQYGRSGCVGCGRCITWCPVGIDITAEAHALLKEAPDA
ncbi:cytochrome C [Ectothiorhodospira haloalkaliphila]|uniref:Cytochrome C n=1 Tax=Ectothiorhodospira haloalkaliphila TaxID=421628 RepID=W8KN81_9GAMM|nr:MULTISPECIES: 4Fe-4S dicluster domain-containing protein [Ectothiorhodospira]AHK78477.1 cytochrome C [Ectothiorhodospira haloalkaliphila]MCG5498354.1 4Fe-4S dicluster domain-containing protein [Ectothiorhodospira variabilis]